MPSKKAAPAAAPKKPSKKELSANNYLVVVALISVVVVIITGVITKALVGNIITNSKVVSGKQKANKDLDAKVEAAPKLIDAYNQLGSTRQDLIAHALPNNEDFPQLVSIMESMASVANTRLNTVSPGAASGDATATTTAAAASGTTAPSATTATGGAQPYSFSTEVVGNYTQIVAYLKNIELSARPMWVPSVEFRGDDTSLKATLKLTTYYQAATDISDKTEAVK